MKKHFYYHAELIDTLLEIVIVDDYVCRIDYVQRTDVPNSVVNRSVECDVARACMHELDLYFDKKLSSFTFPYKFVDGTEFQQSVWHELKKIPYGETISYKELALKCGGANYSRAVANANGKNPMSIVVPCHRVISADGSLGGYTGGVDKKRVLLEHEGVVGGPGMLWV